MKLHKITCNFPKSIDVVGGNGENLIKLHRITRNYM